MAFDAGMLALTVSELHKCAAGGRVEKIYQPGHDEIIINLRANGESFRLLINAGSNYPRMNLTSAVKENPAVPPMFCVMLRKHIGTARLVAARQMGFERAAELEFDAQDELGFIGKKYLIAEIMGKYSNLILTDGERKILGVLKNVDFTTSQKRQVLPGMRYEEPPAQNKRNPLAADREEFLSLFRDFDGPAEKFITNHYMGISTLIAREIAYRADRAFDNGADFASALWAEFSGVFGAVVLGEGTPTLVCDGESNKPLEFAFTDIRQYGAGARILHPESFGKLVDLFYDTRASEERLKQRAADVFRLLGNAESRIVKKIGIQEKELADCDEADKFKNWGDLITANLYALKKGDTKAVVTDYYSEDMGMVEIPMDSRLTPAQNAQKYYKRYAKFKSARIQLTKQIEIARAELAYIYTVFDSLSRAETEQDLAEIREELHESGYASRMKNYTKKKNTAPKPMRFCTTDGRDILCGRNNIQNDYITTKLASRTDWWFHAKNQPGSHVVMVNTGEEPTDRDFTEAAIIAATYSKVADGDNVPVDYTRVRYVKKPGGSKPGYVIYTTNWTAYVTPDKELTEKLRKH